MGNLTVPDLVVEDHFFDNESVADAAIGQLNWEIVTIGNATTYSTLVGTNLSESAIGVLRATTNGTADGDGSVLRLDEDTLLAYKSMEMRWRVRYPTVAGNQLAGNNWRIGLGDSVTATAPTVGIYIESDAGVLTCHTASGDHGDESLAVTGHPTLTGGTTMVIDTWTTFGFTVGAASNAQGGPSEVLFHVDGTTYRVPANIDNDEEMELSIAHWQDTGGGDTLEFDIDYIGLYVPHPAGRQA